MQRAIRAPRFGIPWHDERQTYPLACSSSRLPRKVRGSVGKQVHRQPRRRLRQIGLEVAGAQMARLHGRPFHGRRRTKRVCFETVELHSSILRFLPMAVLKIRDRPRRAARERRGVIRYALARCRDRWVSWPLFVVMRIGDRACLLVSTSRPSDGRAVSARLQPSIYTLLPRVNIRTGMQRDSRRWYQGPERVRV